MFYFGRSQTTRFRTRSSTTLCARTVTCASGASRCVGMITPHRTQRCLMLSVVFASPVPAPTLHVSPSSRPRYLHDFPPPLRLIYNWYHHVLDSPVHRTRAYIRSTDVLIYIIDCLNLFSMHAWLQ